MVQNNNWKLSVEISQKRWNIGILKLKDTKRDKLLKSVFNHDILGCNDIVEAELQFLMKHFTSC